MIATFAQKTQFFAINGSSYKKNAYLCIVIGAVFRSIHTQPVDVSTLWELHNKALLALCSLASENFATSFIAVKDMATIDVHRCAKHLPRAASGRHGVVLHIGVRSNVARLIAMGSEDLQMRGRAGSRLSRFFVTHW